MGVQYRPGMALQVASRRQDDGDAQALWHSTRWLCVHVAYVRGKCILNPKVVYDVSGQPKVNAQLWSVVMQYAARLGNAPHMVCADFNFELGNDDVKPKELFAAKHMGQVVDVMRSKDHTAGMRAHLPWRTA